MSSLPDDTCGLSTLLKLLWIVKESLSFEMGVGDSGK